MTAIASPVSAGYSASSSYEDLPIDIRVDGAPDGYRDLSRWLHMLGECFPEKASISLQDVCLEMDQSWSGEAVEAMSKQLEEARKTGEDMKEQLAQFQVAIDEFADEMDSVRANVREVQVHAQKWGLVQDGSYVYPPRQLPRIPTPGAGYEATAQVHPAYQGLVAQWEAQWDAFHEIENLVAGIREQEEAAHEEFQRLLKTSKSFLGYLAHGLPIIIPKLTRAAFASVYDEGVCMYKDAQKLRREAAGVLEEFCKLPAGQREEKFKEYRTKKAQAERAAKYAKQDLAFDRALWKHVPFLDANQKRKLKVFLEAKPPILKDLPFTKFVPGMSMALTGVSVGLGMAQGMPADEAAADFAAVTVASNYGIKVGLKLFEHRMGVAAIGATVGISALAGCGAGLLVENNYHRLTDPIKDAFD